MRQNCFGCHGPSQQMNGLRLDRGSSVFKNGILRVVPVSNENSFFYHRLIGTEYGLQMPPTGPLRPEQIATLRAWIDQGAEWPDALHVRRTLWRYGAVGTAAEKRRESQRPE
jgi:cytochrome c